MVIGILKNTSKVFSDIYNFIKRMFVKEIFYYKYCLFCGKELNGKQIKYCSNKCNSDYHRFGNKNKIIPVHIEISKREVLENAKRN